MQAKVQAHGREYKFVRKEGVEFSPVQDQLQAIASMKELEARLKELGFECIQKREIKWDPEVHLKVMDESGRYIMLESYYSGDKGTIRQKHSVSYDAQGLEDDVEWAIEQLQCKDEPTGAYTCR